MAEERKVFSEQEVAAVVRRAVELQEAAGAETYQPGVTVAELERVAQELGIDPVHLQRAISETGSVLDRSGLFHLTEEFDRVVDAQLEPDEYDVLLQHLKPTGHRGFQQLGRSVSGQTWTGCSFASFEVRSAQGRTRIKVRSNPFFAWMVSIHPVLFASFVLLPVLGNTGRLGLALAILIPLWIVTGLVFRALVHSGHRASRRLIDNIVGDVTEHGLRERLESTTETAEEVRLPPTRA